jgi:hypothetical protein
MMQMRLLTPSVLAYAMGGFAYGGVSHAFVSRDVRGVIVENQLDRRVGRTVGIEQFEEYDELAAAVAVPDQGMDFAGDQIDPSQRASMRDLCEPLRRFGDAKRSPRRSYGLGGPVLIYALMTTPSNGGTRSRLLNHADVGDNGTNFAPRKIEFRLVRCRRYGAFGKRLR